METAKRCVACGMPMTTKEAFAQGDETRDYCVHCARPDGSMQSYDEKVVSMAEFLSSTKGLDGGEARDAARAYMATLPAWKDDV